MNASCRTTYGYILSDDKAKYKPSAPKLFGYRGQENVIFGKNADKWMGQKIFFVFSMIFFLPNGGEQGGQGPFFPLSQGVTEM